jgi:hypothetical protein
MRLCNSARVLVGLEVLVAEVVGVDEVTGATAGDWEGEAGLGVGDGAAVVVANLRSR